MMEESLDGTVSAWEGENENGKTYHLTVLDSIRGIPTPTVVGENGAVKSRDRNVNTARIYIGGIPECCPGIASIPVVWLEGRAH